MNFWEDMETGMRWVYGLVLVAALFVVPSLLYAGFADAKFVAGLTLGQGLGKNRFTPAYLTQYVFARCPEPQPCELIYRVNGVDLLTVNLGETTVRESVLTAAQRYRIGNLDRLSSFWTERSSLAEAGERQGLGPLLHEVAEDLKEANEVREAKEPGVKGLEKKASAALAIAKVSHGIGFFISEHWFAEGPGSPRYVAIAKQNLARLEFQRLVLRTYSREYANDATGRWAAENTAPEGCVAGQAPRSYPAGFENDETFSSSVMTIPCSRVEFATVREAIGRRYQALEKSGRPLRRIDAEMLAGIQLYGSQQHYIPRPEREKGSFWDKVFFVVGSLILLATGIVFVHLVVALFRWARKQLGG